MNVDSLGAWSYRASSAVSFNKRMNLPALSSDWLWMPGAVVRQTRIDFTAPGCLAI